MKKKILSYYHYGMGGVYFWIMANSAEEVDKRFSLIRVIDSLPDWLTEDAAQKLPTYDIDIDLEDILRIVRS